MRINPSTAPITTLGNGVAGTNATVCPGAAGQKLDGFSFQTSVGTDSVTGLTVTTTGTAAIASVSIWNEAGTTQYFSTVSVPSGNNWVFSGGTPVPVTTTLANFKVLVTYDDHATAPAGNTATTANVTAFTATNATAGTDTADTTLTLDHTAANAATWGVNSGGIGQATLNWTLGTAGDSVMIVRYTTNTDTTMPTGGTTYTVGNSFGVGGTIVFIGTGTTTTDSAPAGTYYYRIFEFEGCLNYSATGPWSAALVITASDARIVYSNNSTTPQYRDYSRASNTFGAQAATVAGAAQTFIVDRASPIIKEHIAGYVTTGGVLYIMRWNGTAWSSEWNVTVGGDGVNGRRFDIAYENTTGRAMVVYSTNALGNSGSAEMAYRIWTGSSWTAAANVVANSSGFNQAAAVTWIKLRSKPLSGSNEIALLAADTGTTTANTSILTSFIWNGSAWTEAATTHTVSAAATLPNTAGQLMQNNCFDMAYESVTGDLLVVFTTGSTAQQWYRTYSGGTWGTATSYGTARAVPLQMVAESDPRSDQILVMWNRSASANVYANVWTGTGVGTTTTVVATGVAPAINEKTISGKWIVSGGTSYAIALSDTTTAGTIGYGYFNGSTTAWTTAQTYASGIGAAVNWMYTNRDPLNSDTMMLTMSTGAAGTGSLWAKRGVGPPPLTWTNADGGSAESTTLASATTQNFSFDYDRYPITFLGNGVAGTTAAVCPGAADQKLDGFSFQTSTGTDSVTGLTVTTTGTAAIASVEIWNEAGTTQYFSTVSVPSGNNWVFSGGTPIPVTTTLANFKILVTYQGYGGPSGNLATTANVTAFTVTNTTAGSDTADTTLTYEHAAANAATWGVNSGGIGQATLNWTLGTAGESVMIVRYTTNTDTTMPTSGTTYTVGNSFGVGGTIVYIGTGTTTTNGAPAGTYYYKIFEFDGCLNYAATAPWSGALVITGATTTLGNGIPGGGIGVISTQQAWTNVYHNAAFPGASSSFAVNAGSNRMLVVAIASTQSAAAAQTMTSVTYGGTAMTLAIGDAATSSRTHTYLYYLPMGTSGTNGASQTVSVTMSGGTSVVNDIYYAVFAGVDQSTPITDSKVVTVTTAGTTAAWATALTVNSTDQAVEIINSEASFGTTPPTITEAANWTMAASQTWTTGNGVTTEVNNYTASGTNTTSSTTLSANSYTSMSGVSLKAGPATNTVCPATVNQKLDGFSFQTNAGTDSITGLTVTTTNYTAIASMQVWDEAGTTMYFTSIANPGSNTWVFSGGTPIPVTSTLANFKVLVTYQGYGGPAGNYATTANVTAFTSGNGNTKAGTDTADTTITYDHTAANAATWGANTVGIGQVTLNWTLGTAGDNVLIVRYSSNTDTAFPAGGISYGVGSSFGAGGTVVFAGTGTTFTDMSVLPGTYYYRIFEYDNCLNYAATAPWSGALAPTAADAKIVYSNNSITPQYENYNRTSNTFGTQQPTVPGSTAAMTFMVDRAAPTRNEHIAGYVTTGGLLYIYRWDGATWTDDTSDLWGGPVTVGGDGVNGRRFDIAYENTSGRAMVVYSNNVAGANNLSYQIWDGTTWTGETTFTAARIANVPTWIKLEAQPKAGSNQIALTVSDTGSTTANTTDLTTLVWNGTVWGNEPAAAHATNMVNTTGQLVQNDLFDMAYESVTGDLLVFFTTATANNYRVFTQGSSTWGTVTSLGTFRAAPAQMTAISNPQSDEVIVAYNNGTAVYANVWNGTAMGTQATISTGTTGQALAINKRSLTGGYLVLSGTSYGVIVWGTSTAGTIGYNRFSGAAWGTAATYAAGTGATANWMDASADPGNSTYMMLTLSTGAAGTGSLWAKRLAVTAGPTFTWTNADGGTAETTALASATSQNFSFAYNRLTQCARSAPAITFSPASGIAYPGGYKLYRVTLMNTDTTGCGDSTFALAMTSDSNAVDFSASTLSATSPSPCTVQPTGTCTATLTVSAKTTATAGNSDITTLTATDGTNHSGQNGTGQVTTTVSCIRNAPTVAFVPASGTVNPGNNAVYTVQVTNNDDAGCGSSTFTLSIPSETGNTASFTLPSVLGSTSTGALAPGATYSTTLTAAAKASAVAGSLITAINIADSTNHSSLTGTGAVTTTVIIPCRRSNPSVSISPLALAVGAGNTVTYTVSVTNNDTSLCAASTFSIGKTDNPASLPNANFTASTLALNSTGALSPGATWTTTLTHTAQAGATGGATLQTYVTATDTVPANHPAVNSFPVVTTVSAAVCVVSAPTVAIVPASATIAASGSIVYSIRAINNDSATCATATFTLSKTDTALGSSFASSNLSATTPNPCTLAPGRSCTATLTHIATATPTNGATLTSTLTAAAAGHTNGSWSVTTDINTASPLSGADGYLLKRARGEACHACHKTDSNAPADPDSIKTHNSAITGSSKWGGNWGVNGASKYGQITCTTCHTSHGTSNVYLIKESIAAPNGVWASTNTSTVNINFQARSGSAGQAGILGDDSATTVPRPSSREVCEGCHSQTSYHKYNQSALYSHESAAGVSDCTTCHSHKRGFAPIGGCTICHARPQGNRAAVVGLLSSNSHHVQGVAVTDQQCYQCHWEANSNGTVNTAYHGGAVTPGAPVKLVIYGAGTRPTGTFTEGVNGISYTAGSSRSETQKVNQHCLGCHSAQNDTTQPFGDGKTPKQYAWDGMSINDRYSQSGTTTWGKYPTAPNTAPKNITKAYSAHGNAAANQRGWNTTTGVDGAITNTGGGIKVLCLDCHNSHGSTVSGTTTSYTSATASGGILKDVTAGVGGSAVTYKPVVGGQAGAPYNNLRNPGGQLCFDCHMNASAGSTPSISPLANPTTQTPWGYNSTFGSSQPIITYFEKPYWYGAAGTNPAGAQMRYAYKNGIGSSGGHFGASSSLNTTPMKTINGLCTPCHDPHGVSPALGGNQQYGVPLLKGTWMTSPYKEDSGPASTTEHRGGGDNNPNPYAGASTPGYHIDQNTFETITTSNAAGGTDAAWVWPGTNRITQTDAQFGGLCLSCHSKTDIHPNTSGAWKTYPRLHNAVQGWGGSGGNAANAIHGFPCSKCHTPHNSCLPRLMITNCTDYQHRGEVVSGGVVATTNCTVPGGNCSQNGSSGTGNGRYPSGGGGSGDNRRAVVAPGNSYGIGGDGPWFAPLAGGGGTSRTPKATLNACHMVSGAGGTTFPTGQQWNSKTPWPLANFP